jgi:rhodanese-related sulfurtransferase
MSTLLKSSLYAFFCLLLSLTHISCLSGQEAQVNSNSFGFMLKTLLSHTVPEVEVAKAVQAPSNTVFLDAREPKEFQVSHIQGARFVGYDNFSLESVSDLPKSTPLIVYCSVGYRSEKVSEQLITAGFSDVANLYGGVFEWKNTGHPVVDTTGTPTESVHAYNHTWGVWLKEGNKVYK